MSKRKTPQPPERLDATASAKYIEIARLILARDGSIDVATFDAIENYAVAWSRWQAAEAKVGELGPVVKSAGGFAMQSPYVGIAREAQRQVRQWGTELKLLPRSRARAAKPSNDQPGGDPLLALFPNQSKTG